MDILNTPPDPRLILFFSVMLVISVQVCGQSIEDERVRIAINQKYDSIAEQEIFQQSRIKKYRFLNFIPSPGYSVLQGPSLSYNLGSIFSFLETKERYRIQAEETRNKYKEKAEQEYKNYLKLKEEIAERESEIDFEEKLLVLEKKLFAISEQKYQNHEITPTEYLQDEISFRRKELTYDKKKQQLIRLRRQITSLYPTEKYYADRY